MLYTLQTYIRIYIYIYPQRRYAVVRGYMYTGSIGSMYQACSASFSVFFLLLAVRKEQYRYISELSHLKPSFDYVHTYTYACMRVHMHGWIYAACVCMFVYMIDTTLSSLALRPLHTRPFWGETRTHRAGIVRRPWTKVTR